VQEQSPRAWGSFMMPN